MKGTNFIQRCLYSASFADRFFIGFIFFYALFFPSFREHLGTAGAIMVNGGIILLSAFYFVIVKKGILKCQSSSERDFLIFIGLVMGYYLVSTLLATFFLSEQVIMRDLYEIHRPPLYLLVTLLPFYLVKRYEDIDLVEKWLRITFAIICVFGVNQILGIVPILSILYTEASNVRIGRISAPFMNPYDFAFVMNFFIVYFFLKFLKERKIVSLFSFVMGLLLITLTQSRSVFGGMAISLGVFTPLVLVIENFQALKSFRMPKSIFYYVIAVFFVVCIGIYIVVAYRDSISYLVNGFEKVLMGRELKSASMRKEQFLFAVLKANQSVWVGLFGNGPSKVVMEYVESIYTYFFFRYGIVGFLVVFILPWLTTVFLLTKFVLISKKTKILLMSILIWMLTMPVSSVGNNFTEQIRVSFLYYFFIALAVRCYFLEKEPAMINQSEIVSE